MHGEGSSGRSRPLPSWRSPARQALHSTRHHPGIYHWRAVVSHVNKVSVHESVRLLIREAPVGRLRCRAERVCERCAAAAASAWDVALGPGARACRGHGRVKMQLAGLKTVSGGRARRAGSSRPDTAAPGAPRAPPVHAVVARAASHDPPRPGRRCCAPGPKQQQARSCPAAAASTYLVVENHPGQADRVVAALPHRRRVAKGPSDAEHERGPALVRRLAGRGGWWAG